MFEILLAISAVTVTTPPPIRVINLDARDCSIMEKIADDMQAELPKIVDRATRLDGFVVLCSLRTVSNAKFVDADLAQMRSGWRERKQRQWNEINCENEAFLPMIRRGWRFVQVFTLRSGERYSMDAICK
jgi:hypothetical protein